jgi:hypothetical protein
MRTITTGICSYAEGFRPSAYRNMPSAYDTPRDAVGVARRHMGSYAEGHSTLIATLAGCPGGPLRRRYRYLAVGVGVGRRHLCPFLQCMIN